MLRKLAKAQLAQAALAAGPSADVARRERYFFELYRAFEAVLLAGLCFSPFAADFITLVSPTIARIVSAVYLVAALGIFLYGRRAANADAPNVVLFGLTVDLLAATATIASARGFDGGIAALMLVNVGCGALLLPSGRAYGFALLAAIGVFAALLVGADAGSGPRAIAEGALFAMGYLAVTALCQLLRRHVSEAHLIVEQQGIDLANLTQLNDLIIRRMRTGVLVVDADNVVIQYNESAWHLLGNPTAKRRELGEIAPEISRRLYHWRTTGKADSSPVALAEGMPEAIPRFVKLGGNDEDSVIVFLDDTSLLTRQAEQLTLTSLGRLSASIAHEIRNPLAAISYSAQLLAESEEIGDADNRLIDIIRAQCARVNSIVENILQLSRRERSRPEPVDLSAWCVAFVDEYKTTHPMDRDDVRAVVPPRSIQALVDAGQLHQVVWNLVQNARRYGRLPDQPARVSLIARRLGDSGPPVIEVVDRGPGIPKRVSDQIFDPFYTTNEHGTGLGLYIARQLCEANQGSIEYVAVAGGGSCFRITLPPQATANLGTSALRSATGALR